MTSKIDNFNQTHSKKNLLEIRPGDTVKVYQKTVVNEQKSGKKEGKKMQAFEGLVITRKHGKGLSTTITVRKVISGIGVEKIFPIHSPNIENIEILTRGKVRRAKLYYLRTAKGRKARLKKKDFVQENKKLEEAEDKEIVQNIEPQEESASQADSPTNHEETETKSQEN